KTRRRLPPVVWRCTRPAAAAGVRGGGGTRAAATTPWQRRVHATARDASRVVQESKAPRERAGKRRTGRRAAQREAPWRRHRRAQPPGVQRVRRVQGPTRQSRIGAVLARRGRSVPDNTLTET